MKTQGIRTALRRAVFLATLSLTTHGGHGHSPSFSDGLVPAKNSETGKWGYLDAKGNWALPAKVDSASEFSGGIAIVKLGNKTLAIDTTGKARFTSQWEAPGFRVHFSSDRLRIKKEGKQGFLDPIGKVVIEAKYDDARDFSEGVAAVALNGKWGFIKADGEELMPPRWDAVGDFRKGMASVSEDGKSGFLDQRGEIIIAPQFDHVQDYNHGVAIVRGGRGEDLSVIGRRGEILTPPKWKLFPQIVGEDRIVFQHGNADTGGNGLWGLADTKGNILVEPKWFRVGTNGYSSGLAVAVLPSDDGKEAGLGGYIDRAGAVVIPYRFTYTNWFQDGLAFATDGEKAGYIDQSGEFAFTMPN